MTDNKAPIIKPIKLKQYECKQSNYEVAPQLAVRALILSPSGGGKTVLLVNMIMDIYKRCFNRIYIFQMISLLQNILLNVTCRYLYKRNSYEKDKRMDR